MQVEPPHRMLAMPSAGCRGAHNKHCAQCYAPYNFDLSFVAFSQVQAKPLPGNTVSRQHKTAPYRFPQPKRVVIGQ